MSCKIKSLMLRLQNLELLIDITLLDNFFTIIILAILVEILLL